MANETILKTIRSLKETGETPVLSLLRDPVQASVISKFITDENASPKYDKYGNRKPNEPDLLELRRLAGEKINDLNDADTVMQLLPDLELSAQILISSILSPKDMMTTELSFIPPETVCPPNIAGSMSRIIKDHFSTNYKIESSLYGILRDILYEKGSHVIAIIPENAIDEIINSNNSVSKEEFDNLFGKITSTESLLPPKGLLGSPDREIKGKVSFESYMKKETTKADTQVTFSLESVNEVLEKHYTVENKDKESFIPIDASIDLNSYLQITDNYEILSVPRLQRHLQKKTVSSIIGSMEEQVKDSYLSDRDIDNLLYRRMHYNTSTMVSVKSNDQGYRKSIGEPLVMTLPSESVIPVHVPGSPEEHIGYLVLLDELGNPLSKDSNSDYYRELGLMTQRNRKCLTSQIMDKARSMYDSSDMLGVPMMYRRQYEHATRTYGEIIEKEIITRFRNGIYGKNVKIGGSDEIYRIMFARALMQQYTQVLFLPVEIVTYMAFRFDEHGIGESLLDTMKIPNSLAITLMLANTRAGVMNSIPRTKVEVKLDEDEPDPEGRRDQIVNEYLLMRANGNNNMPVGTINPVDINTWATQANVEFQFTGAASMPDMSIDIQDFSSSVPKPDTDLEEDMRKKRIMGQGLAPETVDASHGANFATSVVQESLLFGRRVMTIQEKFIPLLTDYVQKVSLASPYLLENLEEVVRNNFDEVIKFLLPDRKEYNPTEQDKIIISKQAVIAFIRKLTLDLPKPNGLALEKKKEAYTAYSDALEEGLNNYIASEIMPTDILGELSDKADSIKSMLKAHFLRKWMVENDYLTELNDLVSLDEDDNPVFDVYEMVADFGSAIEKSIAKVLDKARPMKESVDIYMNENNVEEGDSFSSSSNDDTTDSGGDDFSDFGDFGGEEDFSMDDTGDTGDTSEDTGSEEDLDGPSDNEI